MEWYSGIKFVHVFTIHISITFFVLRFLMDSQGFTVWRNPPWKYLPHINDSLLLLSALALLKITGWTLFVHFWITVKVLLVVAYIVMGWFAMRQNLKPVYRWISFTLALGLFALIYLFAVNKFM